MIVDEKNSIVVLRIIGLGFLHQKIENTLCFVDILGNEFKGKSLLISKILQNDPIISPSMFKNAGIFRVTLERKMSMNVYEFNIEKHREICYNKKHQITNGKGVSTMKLGEIPMQIIRSNRKTLAIELKQTGMVVRAPYQISEKEIEQFL